MMRGGTHALTYSITLPSLIARCYLLTFGMRTRRLTGPCPVNKSILICLSRGLIITKIITEEFQRGGEICEAGRQA